MQLSCRDMTLTGVNPELEVMLIFRWSGPLLGVGGEICFLFVIAPPPPTPLLSLPS